METSFTQNALNNIRGVEDPLEKMQEAVKETVEENKEPVLTTGTIMDGINITPPEVKSTNTTDQSEEDRIKQELLQQRLQQILESHKPLVREHKIGPNDPCPCGSGKKYKKCCKSSGKYEKLVRVK